MPDTLTLDQVRDLINTVVAGIRVGDAHDDRVYSLQEVHDRTGWALSELKEDCRYNRIEYTRRGRAIGMTSSQIAKEIQRNRWGQLTAIPGTEPAEEAQLAQVRRASAKAAGRKTPRRIA